MAGPVRLGVIGVGRWGRVYIRTILSLESRCRLTHLGTSKPQNAALVPYPVAVMSDWRAVVQSACEAVIIATPPATHAEIVEACLEAGKPCLVEKPFCTDLGTAERLHARISAMDVPVLVDHTQLFHPAYQALKHHLQQTQEPIRGIVAERLGTERPRPEEPVLWEWGPHDVSLCLDLLQEPPQQVDALEGPRGPAEAPGLVTLRLRFAGGACAWICTGWLAVQKRRLFSVLTDRHGYVMDDLASEKLTASAFEASGRDGVPVWPERGPLVVVSDQSPMTAMVTYFLDGLAGGDRRYFGSRLALEVVRLLERCDAILRGRPQPGPAANAVARVEGPACAS